MSPKVALTPSEKLARRLARYPEAIAMVEDGSASADLRRAIQLLREGLSVTDAASVLGTPRSTVHQWLKDPRGERDRARKDSYRGTCERCRGPTDGSKGLRNAPRFCRECAPDARLFWTSERIIEAILEYERRYGRQPTAFDWNPAMARSHARAERLSEIEARWDEGSWPSVTHVQLRFGSWSAAIEAAGFMPRGPGDRVA